MNNLIKSNEIQLAPFEQKMFDAINDVKISQLSDIELTKFVSELLLQAQVRLGSNMSGDVDTKILMKTIMSDLLSRFGNLSRKDVLLALDKGCNREFLKDGEILFFTPSNFNNWINQYVKQRGRFEIEYQRKLDSKSSQTLSREERKRLAIEAISDQIERIKVNNNQWVLWGFNDSLALNYFPHLRKYIANIRMWEEVQDEAEKYIKIASVNIDIVTNNKTSLVELKSAWEDFTSGKAKINEISDRLCLNKLWQEIQNNAKKECVRALLIEMILTNREKYVNFIEI